MKDWLNIDKLEYNTYDEYKDSKIEWLGDIPNHFILKKIKSFINEEKKSIIQVGEAKENQGKYKFFTSGESEFTYKEKMIDNENLYLATGGKFNVKYFNGEASYSTDTYVINSFYIDNKYLYYCLESQKDAINELFFEGMGLKHLQKNKFKNMINYLPSKKEQLTIVKFLDEKTTIIDKKIEILKKQNKLEKELEKVLINQCVTKGVDSFTKLDKDGNLIDFENKLNRTKEEFDLYMNENGYIDSKIEWLGYIPNHYEIKRIKDLIKYVQSGTTPSSKDVETMSNQTINWFTPGDLNNNILINSKRKINQYSIDTNQVRIIKDKSILFSCVGEIGKIGISLNKTFSNQQITAIIPKKNVNLFYLYFLLKINKEYINSNAYETTLLQLNNNNLININNIIFINNLKEQLAIVKFLDNKTQMLEQKRTKREKEITLLEEYKKTLINDVVTGKIKVIKD